MTRSTLQSLAAATAMALSLTALPAHAAGNGVIDAHAAEWAATIDFEANATAREAAMYEADFFRAFMVQYNETWSPGATSRFDIDVPAKFYQQTERLFAFDVFPPAEGFQGWDAYAEELTAIVARSSEFNVAMREDTFRYARNGDVAWMSASIDVDGKTADGTPYAMQARQTVVLEKIGDRWLVAHEHISAPFVPGGAG
ncbi:MAG: nuclear transport factor 2 family protein [Pseudomonadota bacterium]